MIITDHIIVNGGGHDFSGLEYGQIWILQLITIDCNEIWKFLILNMILMEK